MLYYSWNKMGCLVTASSMAWLVVLYPAKMVLFIKWLFNIEIIKENVDRYKTRSVHDLVLIHPIDELNLMEELGKVASIANK